MAAQQKRAESIEELFKKFKTTPTTQAVTGKGFVRGVPEKEAAAIPLQRKRLEELTEAEKLELKIGEIELKEREKLAAEKAAKLDLPYINLQNFPISPEAISLIDRAEAEKLKCIAFLKTDEGIRLATTNFTQAVKDLANRLAKDKVANVQIYFVSERSLESALKIYDALPEIKEIIFGLKIEEDALARFEKEISSFRDLREKIAKVSTSDLITLMLGAALKSGASDIHIEAEEQDIKLRFRIDGILQDAAELPRGSWRLIISRLKLLSGAKINIEDVPQDGRITLYLANEKIEIRLSFLPTAYGESVVMRILRPKAIALEFENLGIRGKAYEQLKREIARPNGMIVTTGPTGSGKTTTLYAVLKKLNTAEVKIITLEDPIEYKLVGINQSQVDYEKKYDFARGLRSILRQDPDIVMVGEIRDLETADMAIQAALTGHLVITTIHTNSAAGAIPRFLSMGVKPFLLAPSINAIIGQRLVRRLCETCKREVKLSGDILEQVKKTLGAISQKSEYKVDLSKLKFWGPPEKTEDCKECGGLGYKGRVGIYEIMAMTKEIENLILTGNVSEFQMFDIATKQGMITMAQDGLLKALDGITSVDEVLRVAETGGEAGEE